MWIGHNSQRLITSCLANNTG